MLAMPLIQIVLSLSFVHEYIKIQSFLFVFDVNTCNVRVKQIGLTIWSTLFPVCSTCTCLPVD